MKSDLIASDPIVVDMNNHIVVPYTPLFSIFESKVYSQNMADLQVSTTKIQNIEDIKANPMSPLDTEMKHIKASKKNFNFSLVVECLAYQESQIDNNDSMDTITDQIIKQLFVNYDKEVIGSNNLCNPGIIHTPGTLILETSSVSDINTLLTSVNNLKERILNASQTDASNIIFLLFGSKINNIINQLGHYGITGGSALDAVLGKNSWKLVPGFINSDNMIVGFDPSQCILHRGFLPQVWKKGTNDEMGYNYIHFIKSSCAVEVINHGAAIMQRV